MTSRKKPLATRKYRFTSRSAVALAAAAARSGAESLAEKTHVTLDVVIAAMAGEEIDLALAIALEGHLQDRGLLARSTLLPSLRRRDEELPILKQADSNLAQSISPGLKNVVPRGRRAGVTGRKR